MLRALAFDVVVENPFAHQSKTDMVQVVDDADIRAALLRSVSCATRVISGGRAKRILSTAATACRAYTAVQRSSPRVWTRRVISKMCSRHSRNYRPIWRATSGFSCSSREQPSTPAKSTLLRPSSGTEALAEVQTGDEYTARAAMLKRWATSFIDLTRQRSSAQTRRILESSADLGTAGAARRRSLSPRPLSGPGHGC